MHVATAGGPYAGMGWRWVVGMALLVGCGDDSDFDAPAMLPGATGGVGTAGSVDSVDSDGGDDANDGGDDTSSQPGDSGDDDGDDGELFDVPPPDDGLSEICDGFDNNGNGQVDETCACEPGDVQSCFAGLPQDAIACRATRQVCQPPSDSEAGGTWGECGGLCDDATLSLDDPTSFRVLGAAAGDLFVLTAGGGRGDINGDGELDFVAASVYGDAVAPDVGAAYALYGGPCMQGATIDLAAVALDGGVDEDFLGGFVVDNATAFDVGGSPPVENALLADGNGDGFADVLATRTGKLVTYAFGGEQPAAIVDTGVPDELTSVQLTGGGGSWRSRWGLGATDYDGDGYDDAFQPSFNNAPTCPCATDGVAVWWGREQWLLSEQRDAMIEIGVGTAGASSQSNHSVVGGAGDFNGDGFLDITAGHGASNDGYGQPYRAFAFFGQADRTLPGSMTSVDGTNGFYLGGGPDRGPLPNHQHGDFNGDGVDDFVAHTYANGSQIYVVYGSAGAFPATLTVGSLGADGLVIESTGEQWPAFSASRRFGVGDIDADGFDDIAVGLAGPDGGVMIIWGRDHGQDTLVVDEDDAITIIEGGEGLGYSGQIAIEDVDGDGLGDLLVGAPHADTINGANTGAGIIKFGSCLAALHNESLVRGQDGDDLLTSGPERETIAAGRGDDVLRGGALDVLHGGGGDDTIEVDALTFARVDGGAGEDTLQLEGELYLDLRTARPSAFRNLEAFVLGEGPQTLVMNRGHVSALSPTSNRIEVSGGADDQLVLVGPWLAGAPADGLSTYRHGALLVAVDPSVDVSVLAD